MRIRILFNILKVEVLTQPYKIFKKTAAHGNQLVLTEYHPLYIKVWGLLALVILSNQWNLFELRISNILTAIRYLGHNITCTCHLLASNWNLYIRALMEKATSWLENKPGPKAMFKISMNMFSLKLKPRGNYNPCIFGS